MMSNTTNVTLRSELGDFSSIVFLKAILTGFEEALGEKTTEIALNASGRKLGKNLAQELNLVNKGAALSLAEMKEKMNQILGKQGTRLCIIDKIELSEDVYKVYTKETFCSAGESQGSSRKCSYTLGVIQGFLETVLNKRLRGQQTESVLRGGTYDLLEYSVIAISTKKLF